MKINLLRVGFIFFFLLSIISLSLFYVERQRADKLVKDLSQANSEFVRRFVPSENQVFEPAPKFSYSEVKKDFSGSANVSGYLTLEGEKSTFHVLESTEKILFDFLDSQKDSKLVTGFPDYSFSIGCYEKDQKIYSASSDASSTSFSIEGEDLQRMLSSTPDNPIDISITKKEDLGKVGELCPSYFSGIKVTD